MRDIEKLKRYLARSFVELLVTKRLKLGLIFHECQFNTILANYIIYNNILYAHCSAQVSTPSGLNIHCKT